MGFDGFRVEFLSAAFLLITIVGTAVAYLKLKNATMGNLFLTMIITYVVLAFLIGGEVTGAFAPRTLFGTDRANSLFFIAVLSGIGVAGITYIIKTRKESSFDVLLGIISIIIPLVGLVLCIVNRAKNEKDIPASNVYLACPITGGALGLFIFGVMYLFHLL